MDKKLLDTLRKLLRKTERRVGDYTLVMKDDWTITDWLPGEKRYALVGVHGGSSVEEMRVPLIEIRV